jgi:hypothetical protein
MFGPKRITIESKVNMVWKTVLIIWYEEVITEYNLDEGAKEYLKYS